MLHTILSQSGKKAEPQPGARAQAIPAAVALLAAGLTLYMGFKAGGFFAGTTAVVAVVLALALLLRVMLAADPFAGFGVPLAIAGGALGLYAAWCLLSALWSDAPARAMIEFDRALLYWLALVLFGSFRRRPANVEAVVRGVAAALLVICAAGLASRILPDLVPVSPGVANERLSHPVTYWNALGLLASWDWCCACTSPRARASGPWSGWLGRERSRSWSQRCTSPSRAVP